MTNSANIATGQETAAVTPPLLSLQQASVCFPGESLPTLKNINLEIRPGEFLSIVGPSGCGKSTLLRLIAGLIPPSEGQRLTEQTSSAALQIDRPGGISMVFQESRLLPWRTVFENMRLPFELTGQPTNEERILRLLDKTGLGRGDHQKFPRMLSGGMKMRVSVARALVLEPRLILLDEPFAAVDDMLREQLNTELLMLQQTFGFAAVLVTHHLAEAVYLSERLLSMSSHPGQISQTYQLSWPRTRPETLRDSAEFSAECSKIRQAMRT